MGKAANNAVAMQSTEVLERCRSELSRQRREEWCEDPELYRRNRDAETWACPKCGSVEVAKSSYGDGIICNCGFAPYPWNWERGRTTPAILKLS